ncbi:MAG: CapA family protein [Opitutaceae bacterium]|nr:CapA family protein [Opitutaceae bacterium]
MKKNPKTQRHGPPSWLSSRRPHRFCAIAVVGVAALSGIGSGSGFAQHARPPVDTTNYKVRDLTKELANKMTGTYTIAAVGDVLMQEPMSKLISPEILKVLREADTTVGNMEVYLVDRKNWAGSLGYTNNWAPKEMARDFADMGFDLLAPGEAQGGEEGMRSSIKYLDEVGIQLAGYGPNLSIARQPVFQHLPQGRVAMVSAYPVGAIGDPNDAALGKDGASGIERWGLNPLRLKVWNVVTKEQLQQLKAIRDSLVARRHEPDVVRPIAVPSDQPDRVTLFSTNYLAGPKPGEYHYEMSPADLDAQLRAVRNAKEYADYVIFTMHVHENRYAFQAYSSDNYPTNYVVDLARRLVDHGMDVYVGHGNHTIQGIEIYKGRPIFYNLGNFSVHRFGSDNDVPPGATMTSIERGEIGDLYFQQDENLVAIIARTKYQNGKLEEVRIYPVDLGVGQNRPWSRMNVPMTPSPELAQKILTDLQKYSEPFGTKISIENNIGIIRVPPAATVPVGGDIRAKLGPQPPAAKRF